MFQPLGRSAGHNRFELKVTRTAYGSVAAGSSRRSSLIGEASDIPKVKIKSKRIKQIDGHACALDERRAPNEMDMMKIH